MPVNCHNDHSMLEGRRTVVYRDDTLGISVTVPNAVRYDVADRNTAGSDSGKFSYGDVIWELSSEELEDEPSESGAIVDLDAGESWSALDVEHLDLVNVWRCTCRRTRENVN